VKKTILNTRFLFSGVLVLSAVVGLLILLPGGLSFLGPNIIMLWVLLSIAGTLLVIYTFREKTAGKLKTYLVVAGFSAAAFFPGVLLHNMLYALSTLAGGSAVVHAFLNFLEGVFFLGAVILCPIGECVGVIGTLIHWRKHENG
jgi:hypothetical protein